MRAFLVAALGLLTASCLDFDRYGEGAGGVGAGGGNDGANGGSGGAPSCGSGPLPSAVCITGALYGFENGLDGDWASVGPGTVTTNDVSVELTLQSQRLDLRTAAPAAVVDDCFASIQVFDVNAARIFLELVPDGPDVNSDIPEADLAQNIEVAFEDELVRFRVPGATIPSLPLPPGPPIDTLRIQVRESTVVLEALAEGLAVACHEEAKPMVLDGAVRAGFGLQGSSGQTAAFDNYGVSP